MGNYTELHYNAELKKDTPKHIIKILKFMVGDSQEEPKKDIIGDHAFFSCERWKWIFQNDNYYFDADTHCTLRFDDNGGSYYLCIRSNLKNYDSEIEKFIDWIEPYINKDDRDFLGFYRYEEDEDPTLIYKGREFKVNLNSLFHTGPIKLIKGVPNESTTL